jgi:hypothetical protein
MNDVKATEHDKPLPDSEESESPCIYYVKLFRAEHEASMRVRNDPKTRARNEKLLAALDSLPGKLRLEILDHVRRPRHLVWQSTMAMPPELMRALGLDEGTAFSYQDFILQGPKRAKKHAA